GVVAAVPDDGGVVAGEVVPDGDDALGVEPERHGSFDGGAGAVTGLADAGDLFGVFEGDLDGPAAGVAFHDPGDRSVRVGGDQHADGAGAEHAAPQAALVVHGDGGGAAVAGDGEQDGGAVACSRTFAQVVRS